MSRYKSKTSGPIAYINVTPLVDVLLILVAILMLLLPLYIKKLPVNLPKTESVAGAPELSKAFLVSLDITGKLYLDQALITEADLLAKINPSVSIKFAVGADVTYEKLAQTVAKLKNKNPKEITLIVN